MPAKVPDAENLFDLDVEAVAVTPSDEAMLPTVVMLVEPSHVDSAVFSTLFSERMVLTLAALFHEGRADAPPLTRMSLAVPVASV